MDVRRKKDVLEDKGRSGNPTGAQWLVPTGHTAVVRTTRDFTLFSRPTVEGNGGAGSVAAHNNLPVIGITPNFFAFIFGAYQYLISVRHLLPTEEYQQTKELAAEFLKGIGPKLEWILKLKSW